MLQNAEKMDQPVKTQAEYTALLHTVLGARYGDAPRAFVHTYGCQGNVADGERIKGMLARWVIYLRILWKAQIWCSITPVLCVSTRRIACSATSAR